MVRAGRVDLDLPSGIEDPSLGRGGKSWVPKVWEGSEKVFALPVSCPGQVGRCYLLLVSEPSASPEAQLSLCGNKMLSAP